MGLGLMQYPLNFFNDMWHRLAGEPAVEPAYYPARYPKRARTLWVNHQARYKAIRRNRRKVMALGNGKFMVIDGFRPARKATILRESELTKVAA